MGNHHYSKEYLAKIGKRGGKATFKKRGSKFFRTISLKRKKFRGGRPRKKKEESQAA
jgi:hypothetical protein